MRGFFGFGFGVSASEAVVAEVPSDSPFGSVPGVFDEASEGVAGDEVASLLEEGDGADAAAGFLRGFFGFALSVPGSAGGVEAEVEEEVVSVVAGASKEGVADGSCEGVASLVGVVLVSEGGAGFLRGFLGFGGGSVAEVAREESEVSLAAAAGAVSVASVLSTVAAALGFCGFLRGFGAFFGSSEGALSPPASVGTAFSPSVLAPTSALAAGFFGAAFFFLGAPSPAMTGSPLSVLAIALAGAFAFSAAAGLNAFAFCEERC